MNCSGLGWRYTNKLGFFICFDLVFPSFHANHLLQKNYENKIRIHAVIELNGRCGPIMPPSSSYKVLMCWNTGIITWLTRIRLFLHVLIREADGQSSWSCWQRRRILSSQRDLLISELWLAERKFSSWRTMTGWLPASRKWLDITDYRLLFSLLFYFKIYFCRCMII